MTIKTRGKKVSQKTVSRTGNTDTYVGDIDWDWHFCLTGCRFSHLAQNVLMFSPLLGRGGVLLEIILSLSVLAETGSKRELSPEEVVLTSSHWWSGVITLSQFQQFRFTDGGRVAMQLELARSTSHASVAAVTVPLFTTSVLPGFGTSGDMATAFTVSVFPSVDTVAALAAVTGAAGVGGDGGTAGLSAAW